MRPLISIKSARIAACAYAALTLSVLLPASAVGAGAAQNVFGGAARSSTQAATPTPAKGAVKVTTQVAKQSAAGAKFAPPVVKTTPSVVRAPKTTATTATAATQEASTGTSSSMIIALVLGVLLLGGIAFVIVRDARSVAPVVEGATGGTRNPEGRLRKRRAQAKAARRQRKRHRKR
jgi:hypothetical protein